MNQNKPKNIVQNRFEHVMGEGVANYKLRCFFFQRGKQRIFSYSIAKFRKGISVLNNTMNLKFKASFRKAVQIFFVFSEPRKCLQGCIIFPRFSLFLFLNYICRQIQQETTPPSFLNHLFFTFSL